MASTRWEVGRKGGRAMRSMILHPFGLVLLIASLVLAGAMRFAPGLGGGSADAPWVLFWGLLAYGASVIGLLRSRPDVSAPELGRPDTPDKLSEADNLSERAIRGHLRSKAIQHPATLLPLGMAFVSAIYLARRFTGVASGRSSCCLPREWQQPGSSYGATPSGTPRSTQRGFKH